MNTTTPPKNLVSAYSLLFCILFLTAAAFTTSRWHQAGQNAPIRWDISGYYFYLPSLFYDDLCKLNQWEHFMNTYQPSPIYDQAVYVEKTGCYVMKYSSGMALMYLPSFAMAHFWAKISGYPADGYSFPYQFMIAMGSIAFACIGLWVSRKLLLLYFSDAAVATSLLLLTIGTNFFFFVSFDGPLSHSYLFTLYAILLYLSDKWAKKPSIIIGCFIGIVCGLAALTRPTEIIAILIPLLWGVYNKTTWWHKIHLLKNNYKSILAAAFFTLSIGFIQLVYWKIHAGTFLFYSYQDQGFNFLKPHLFNYLLSFKKGWLIYTPMMLFALIGFVFLYQLRKHLFLVCFLFFTIFLYIAASWDIWWYGGSCTQRSIIQCYAILLFPLTAFFSIKRNLIYSLPFILFFTWINLFQVWQVLHTNIMECDQMNRTYYWKIFGKTSIEKSARKFIDTNEREPNNKVVAAYLQFYFNDMENIENKNCDMAFSGLCALKLDSTIQLSPEFKIPLTQKKSGWLRYSAKVFFPEKEYDVWKQTQMIITFYNRHHQVVKSKQIRIQRITEPGNWEEVFFDTKIPKAKAPEYIILSFKNVSRNKTIYIDDVKLYYTQP